MATDNFKNGTPNPHLHSPYAWMWASIWSAAFTLIFMRTLYVDRCFGLVTGTRLVWTTGIVAWMCLFVFFLLNNRGRLVLLPCLLVGYFLRPEVFRVRFAAAEASTISTLQQLTRSADAYKNSHPLEGYPSSLPKFQSGNYPIQKSFRFEYVTLQSRQGGPADGYLIKAIPVFRECGFLRSFTASSDGHIYYTLEERAAMTTDKAIR